MERKVLKPRRVSRALLAITAAALIGTAFTGCSATGNTTAKGGIQPLTMYNDNPQWKDGFVKAGDEIAKTTGYSLNPIALPSTANYTQTVLASLPTNKSGDIIKWWSGKMLQGLAATGQLQDLTKQWDDAVAKGEISNDLRPYYSYNGKVFAVPFVQSYWVTFYSKTAFQKAGIAAPPTTWSDLESDLAKLKTAGYQFCTGQSEGWPSFVPFQMFVGAVSPDFYTQLTDNKAKFDAPEVKQALTTWQKWIKNGWTTSADTKTFDCPAAMKAGKVAMVPMGTWANGLFKTAGLTDSEYGAFLTPSMTDGQAPGVFLEGGAIAVPKNAPHKDGALKAIAAWLTAPVQTIWSGYIGDSSPNPKVVATDPVIKSVAEQITAQKPTILNRYYESLPPKLVQSTISTLGGFMVDPGNPDKTMSDLSTQAKTEWAAWNKNPSIG
jgi:multiple sugar transport system substrate-binding protein